MPSPTRPRWRPRFSLLTLLLSVLLCGSGMLLWKNRAPWVVLTTITTDGPIHFATFSVNGKYFLIHTIKNAVPPRIEEKIQLRDSTTGELVRNLSDASVVPEFGEPRQFSVGEKYVWSCLLRLHRPTNEAGTTEALLSFWRIDTGETLDFAPLNVDRQAFPLPSPQENFVLIRSQEVNKYILAKLPGLETVQFVPDSFDFAFSTDDKWLLYFDKSPYPNNVLVSTATGLAEKHFAPGSTHVSRLSPDGRTVAIPFDSKKIPSVGLFDVNTERQLYEIEGRFFGPGFSENNKYITTFTNDKVRILSADSKQVLLEFANSSAVIGADRLLVTNPDRIYDLRTANLLCTLPDSNGELTRDGEYVLYNSNSKPQKKGAASAGAKLVRAENGKDTLVFDLSKQDPLYRHFQVQYTPKPRRVLNYFPYPNSLNDVPDPRHRQLQLWHRRRPEDWWGIAYLWEFWLVVLLSAGLAWSIFKNPRSRKVMEK